MPKNVGTVDRIVRFLLTIGVAVLYFAGVINGTLAIVLGVLAVVFLLTGLVSFCPIWAVLRISTAKKKS